MRNNGKFYNLIYSVWYGAKGQIRKVLKLTPAYRSICGSIDLLNKTHSFEYLFDILYIKIKCNVDLSVMRDEVRQQIYSHDYLLTEENLLHWQAANPGCDLDLMECQSHMRWIRPDLNRVKRGRRVLCTK